VADELLPDGITIGESIAFAKALEREGVDWIDVMLGSYETNTYHPRGSLSYRQEKSLFDVSEAFKKVLRIPVFARSYGQYDIAKWDEAIENEQCDVIQIGDRYIATLNCRRRLRKVDLRGFASV
jgi:2,4-dienoyl-CoA reductase-like NADH-dependent reductase (Old Yellow Enzyme family)